MIFAFSNQGIQWYSHFVSQRLCCSDSKRSRSRSDKKFPGFSIATLELVVIPMTKNSGCKFGPSPNSPHPTRKIRNEGGGFCQCWSSGYGYQRFWAIRLRGHWILFGKLSGGVGCCLQTGDRYSVVTNSLQNSEMGEGRPSENPIVLDGKEDNEKSPSTTALSERRPIRKRIGKVPKFVYRTGFAITLNYECV